MSQASGTHSPNLAQESNKRKFMAIANPKGVPHWQV